MAELLDLKKDFDKGNIFMLHVIQNMCEILGDQFRFIVKYDAQEVPEFDDDKLNVVFSLSKETHYAPQDLKRKDIFCIFQNYFILDSWGHPVYNPIVYPLPLGPFVNNYNHNIDIKPIPERKYDFCFIGQIPHTGTRDCFKRNLDKLIKHPTIDRYKHDKFEYFVEFTDSFGSGMGQTEYLELLNDSKISLCPQGAFSFETFRFFESLMMGSLPMLESLPKLWYYQKAPHIKTRWHELDSSISKTLNFLQSTACRDFLYRIAEFYSNVLTPAGLSKHLCDILLLKLNNIDKHKVDCENFRKAYMDTNKL